MSDTKTEFEFLKRWLRLAVRAENNNIKFEVDFVKEEINILLCKLNIPPILVKNVAEAESFICGYELSLKFGEENGKE